MTYVPVRDDGPVLYEICRNRRRAGRSCYFESHARDKESHWHGVLISPATYFSAIRMLPSRDKSRVTWPAVSADDITKELARTLARVRRLQRASSMPSRLTVSLRRPFPRPLIFSSCKAGPCNRSSIVPRPVSDSNAWN